MDNSLKELPEDDVHLLLDELKSDWPLNIHAFSFLNTIQKWKTAGSDHRSRVFALNGDVKSKFIVFYSSSPDLSDIRGSVHKWTHRDDDEQFFLEVLHNSRELIPWDAKIFLLTALTPETSNVVVPFLTEIWKGQEWLHNRGDHLYWMPKEIAKEWTVDIPNDRKLAHLSENLAKEIDALWPHRFQGSDEVITAVIKFSFGLGLFDSTSGELLSWALLFFYGGVGALQTKEDHRRKGYAEVVLKAMCKEISDQGEDVHLNVLPKNHASLSLMNKFGFQLVYLASWIGRGFKL